MAVFALQQEVVPISLPGWEVVNVVTGIGKARAALMTMKALQEHRPQAVLNVGTAGTFSLKVGDIVVCSRFWDRDFARCALPGIDFDLQGSQHPLAEYLCSLVDGQPVDKPFMVSTGDDFVTEGEKGSADVVDMESFAVLQACREEGVPMLSVKYVTDIIGQNSTTQWEERLADARRGIQHYFALIAQAMEGSQV